MYTFHPSFCKIVYISPELLRNSSLGGPLRILPGIGSRPLLDRYSMYTMPPRSAGMFIRSAAAYLLGKRNKSHTTVFSLCRTVQNDEISPKQGFGSTGHSRQISTLRSAGRLRSVFRATRTLYYHPGHTKNPFETDLIRTTPLPVPLPIWWGQMWCI